ncbi:multidrug resistance-associated protein 4-like [Copidosoma floridanum]|uniref:multidrug resistance-associated protein 4-like n=1 Tax=Copidosoma floridanum TaxID=29053 RepID=UPI000C6F726C|nr:multidrug resistance-associated protein 4-like [Copidosoma floridanum]
MCTFIITWDHHLLHYGAFVAYRVEYHAQLHCFVSSSSLLLLPLNSIHYSIIYFYDCRDKNDAFDFFSWLWPIFAVGGNKKLEVTDLYEVLPENLSELNADALEKNWMKELSDATKTGRKASFFRPLWRTFKLRFLGSACHAFLYHIVLQTIEPIAVGLLIWHFDQRATSSTTEIYVYATIFVITRVLGQLVFNHQLMNLRSVGVSARVACTSIIYRKILKLSHTEKQANSGRIINLLSNDAARLELFFLFLHTLWVLPVQTVLLVYLIWHHVGVASLAGIGLLMSLTIPVFGLSGGVIARIRRKVATKTDDRVMLLGEVVRGIRVIKMYTWEKPFEQLVFLARKYEMDVISTAAHLKNFLFAVSSFSKRIPLYVTIIVYVTRGHAVSAYTIFTLVQYFNLLDVLLSSHLMRCVNLTSEGLASMKRIKEFLVLEERTSSVQYLQSEKEESIVAIKDVSVASVEDPKIDVLHDISINVKRRSLTAIVGAVGAGKSLLLKLLLDEARPSKGGIRVFGDVSYASQEPWLFKGTIRENIIFGGVYDADKYRRVVEACALSEDLKQLARGDGTVVGESGATLSGGQCTRVNLARAVYRDADVYLLDDPLSAVDGRVGKRLLEDCINGLLANKTRVLITHQVQFLKESDEIIVMDKGCVKYQGNFTDFQKTENLSNYLNIDDNLVDPNSERLKSNENGCLGQIKNVIKDDENGCFEETHKLLCIKEQVISPQKSVNCEKEHEMKLRKCLYWKYFTSCGSYALPFFTFMVFAFAQLLISGSDYFVAYWSKHQTVYTHEDSNLHRNALYFHSNDSNSNSSYVSQINSSKESEFLCPQNVTFILAFFTLSIIVMCIAKTSLCTIVLNKCNENIHRLMTTSLLRAKVIFFEENDSGRILNRFSKDMGSVDERLRALIVEAAEYFFVIIGIITQIIIINYLSVIFVFFMGYIFYKGRTVVIKTTKDIMRLDGETKSPVFYHVNSTLAGRSTIRACQAQSVVTKNFDDLQDNHTAAAGLCQYSLIAYSFWLDCVTLSFMSVVVYGLLLLKNDQSSGADVGLAITQLITLTGIMARGIKLTGDLDTFMVSTERLFQYTEIEREDQHEAHQPPPPVSWPHEGAIEFKDVSLRYYQSDTIILKNLNFTIEAGDKVLIIGRTGSGKSSLVSALFRLARVEGSIAIDSVDTRAVGLRHLRNKISILPQEPVLFPVTLRKNLDPLQELDDAVLWSTLRDVELHKAFASLDATVDQLSAGQRQLVCLARVILQRRKIVVLDEVTANIDDNTDALIRKTIREKFKDCTVLMISHRLNAIKDVDKVLVMDNGRVVEYDRPQVLLQNNHGYFSRLLSLITKKTLVNLVI